MSTRFSGKSLRTTMLVSHVNLCAANVSSLDMIHDRCPRRLQPLDANSTWLESKLAYLSSVTAKTSGPI